MSHTHYNPSRHGGNHNHYRPPPPDQDSRALVLHGQSGHSGHHGPPGSHHDRGSDGSKAMVLHNNQSTAVVPHSGNSGGTVAFNRAFEQQTIDVILGAFKGINTDKRMHATFFMKTVTKPPMIMMYYPDHGHLRSAGMGMNGPDGHRLPYSFPTFDPKADDPVENTFLGRKGKEATAITSSDLAEIQQIIGRTPCGNASSVAWTASVAKALEAKNWLRADPTHGLPSDEIWSMTKKPAMWFDIGILKAYNRKTGGALNLALSVQCINIEEDASVYTSRLYDTKKVRYRGEFDTDVSDPTNYQPKGFDRPGEFLFIQRVKLSNKQQEYIDNASSRYSDRCSREFIIAFVEKLEDKEILKDQPPKCDKRHKCCSAMLKDFRKKIDV